jgi:non-specific serine/threonine protein kinase
VRCLELLDSDTENLHAALDWSARSSEPETLSGMSAALWDYWCMRGYLGEGHHWLQLAVSAAEQPGVERARLLHGLGIFAGLRKEMADGADYFAASVSMLRHTDAPRTLSRALADRGFCAVVIGDPAGPDLVEEALALARHTGNDREVAYALYAAGFIAYVQADYERAARILRECVALSRAIGSVRGAGYALVQLAASMRALGDPHGAAAVCAEAFGNFHRLGEKWGSYLALIQAALAAAGCADVSRAACLLGAADALRVAVGASAAPGGVHPDYESGMAEARNSLGDERMFELWTKGHDMPLVRAMDLAMRHDPSTLSVREKTTVPDQLTPREREVAVMVALGQSNREIAAELVVALRTAETHIERIFMKIGVRSRVQLARWVLSQNLLTATPRQLGPVPSGQ